MKADLCELINETCEYKIYTVIESNVELLVKLSNSVLVYTTHNALHSFNKNNLPIKNKMAEKSLINANLEKI